MTYIYTHTHTHTYAFHRSVFCLNMKSVIHINQTTTDTHNKYKYIILYTFKPNILLRATQCMTPIHIQNKQNWINLENIKTN
jgi:hypothetical protein